jgi:hypothetical protein
MKPELLRRSSEGLMPSLRLNCWLNAGRQSINVVYTAVPSEELSCATGTRRTMKHHRQGCRPVPGEFKHHATAGVWYSARQ